MTTNDTECVTNVEAADVTIIAAAGSARETGEFQ